MNDPQEASQASAQPSVVAAGQDGKLPQLSLAAAGFTALNSLVALASVALFFWDSTAATPILQRAAPFMILAGVCGVGAGAVIQVKNKRSGLTIPGTKWATTGIITGLLLMTIAVFLPLLFALSMLVDESR